MLAQHSTSRRCLRWALRGYCVCSGSQLQWQWQWHYRLLAAGTELTRRMRVILYQIFYVLLAAEAAAAIAATAVATAATVVIAVALVFFFSPSLSLYFSISFLACIRAVYCICFKGLFYLQDSLNSL